MSRAPVEVDEGKDGQSYDQELARVYYMLQFGRSWSGRERNCCFLNTRGGRFANVSVCSGLDYIEDSRSLATVDWDHDGDLDLWMTNRTSPRVRFLRNDTPRQNHFLSLRLTGNGRSTNRDGIGARVELIVNGQSQRRVKTLHAGSGFQSQSSKWLNFGLGDVQKVDQIVVHWPGGDVEKLAGVGVDRWYEVFQGRGIEPWEVPERKVNLIASTSKVPKSEPTSRTFLTSPHPMLQLEYKDYEDRTQAAFVRGSSSPQRPVLINLWATWCEPCLVELREFGKHADLIRDAGLEIIALNADTLGDERGKSPKVVRETLARLGYSFSSGMATEDVLNRIQLIHDEVFAWHQELTTPMSLLVDGQGKLAAVYKGRVELKQLLADVGNLSADPRQRRELAQPFPGKWLAEPSKLDLNKLAAGFNQLGFVKDAAAIYEEILASQPSDEQAAQAHFALGALHQQQSQLDGAVRHYRRSLKRKPDFMTHNNLARAFEFLERLDEAAEQYAEAVRLSPDHGQVHFNLAQLRIRQKQFDDAMLSLRKAIEVDPELTNAYLALGTLLCREFKRYDDAIALYETKLESDPNDPQILNAIGVVYSIQGIYDEAGNFYRQAVKADPSFQPARDNLRNTLQRRHGP